MRTFLLSLAAATLALGTACGTETGNPELVEFEYNATSSEPARVRLGPSEGGASAASVWLRLADVEFFDCRGDLRGTLEGIGFADHAGEQAALQSLELADDTYCGVRTRLFPGTDSVDEPEAIRGASVSVSGTLPDGRSFRITTAAELELDLELQATPLPSSGGWLLAFDVAEWLDIEALEGIDAEDVLVDADHDAALLQAFEQAVVEGSHLYEDSNGNGQVDDGEPLLDR